MTLNKKKPEQAKRQQTPLVAGIKLPDTKLAFDPAVSVGKLKIGEDAGVVAATRRYDEVADEALEASIRKFGFIEPIVAARDGRILHGVHRYLVATRLQQKTVPVMWVDSWDHDDAETQFYNVYANKLNDWSSWIAENVDEVLRNVDGGVKKKVMEGDDSTFVVVPEETGEYREMASKLGMFIDVIPKKLCASSATLLTLAKLRIKSLGRRYQYNDEQLLYIETLRDAVDYHRRKVVEEEGLNSAGNLPQKLKQESTWDAKTMADGRIVARIVFLHSVGLPNEEISKIVGVPVSNKALRERAKAQGMDSFVEIPTVENALWRSAKRSFSPEDTYGWWITQMLETRADMLADADVAAVLKELEQYREPWTGDAIDDGPMPPVTRLDLSDPKAVELRGKAVDLILDRTADVLDDNGEKVVDEAMAEDWVDWPEALRFYAQECFQHALDEDARKHPVKKGRKSPMDVTTTRQPTDKLCGKKEWQEMVWLDLLNSEPAKYDAMSEDEAAEAEKESYEASSVEYDQTTVPEFNNKLMTLREKYSAGPLTGLFAILQGPEHDGDLSTDPDKCKGGKTKAANK